jgi:hypothetical protein
MGQRQMINPIKYWQQRLRERKRFEEEAKQRRLLVKAHYKAKDSMEDNVTNYAVITSMHTSSGTKT